MGNTQSFLGTWSFKQELRVRFKKGPAPFRFVKSTEDIVMNIHIHGSVNGSVGDAKFDGCSVAKNRNWLFKVLDLNSDYKISGRLIGNTFARDTLIDKEISIRFNMKDNIIDGTLFHLEEMGTFPMVNVHLIKQ